MFKIFSIKLFKIKCFQQFQPNLRMLATELVFCIKALLPEVGLLLKNESPVSFFSIKLIIYFLNDC